MVECDIVNLMSLNRLRKVILFSKKFFVVGILRPYNIITFIIQVIDFLGDPTDASAKKKGNTVPEVLSIHSYLPAWVAWPMKIW